MRIGYWGAGYLLPNKVAADGCYHIRDSFIKELVKNHEVVWLANVRDKEVDALQYPNSPYHKVTKHQSDFKAKQDEFSKYETTACGNPLWLGLGKTKRWYFSEVHKKRMLPQVDLVIVEINTMGLQGYDIMSLLEFYTNRGIKCFLWDMDCWGKRYENIPSEFNVKEDFVYFLTPYKTKIYKQQIEFYYGYDKEKEITALFDCNDVTDFVYVGNDYHRGKKLIKFYKDLDVNIYGNFKKDKENIVDAIGRQKFRGPLIPDDVLMVMYLHRATVQVVRKEYEKIGLMTQRINEASYAALICFIDSDIKNAKDVVPADQVVSNSDEVERKLDNMICNNETGDRVKQQRKMLPTYGSQLNKIFSLHLL